MIRALLGDKPLVLDREFSFLELLEYLVHVTVNFVICLNLASHPTFYDASGRKVTLTVSLGEQSLYHGLRYLDQVTVNVVGIWRKGRAEPIWVMSDLSPEQASSIYAARTRIEETLAPYPRASRSSLRTAGPVIAAWNLSPRASRNEQAGLSPTAQQIRVSARR